MPVKKGRDLAKCRRGDNWNMESKALRAISVYAERSNKRRKYVYPELAATLRLVVDVGFLPRAVDGVKTVGVFLCA